MKNNWIQPIILDYQYYTHNLNNYVAIIKNGKHFIRRFIILHSPLDEWLYFIL